MPEGVIIQLIATLGLIVVAAIGLVGGRKRLDRIAADAREARDQTANTHSTNLRDDIDALHARVGGVQSDVAGVHAELRGVRRDINGLREDDGEIRRQIRLAEIKAHEDLVAHIEETEHHPGGEGS